MEEGGQHGWGSWDGGGGQCKGDVKWKKDRTQKLETLTDIGVKKHPFPPFTKKRNTRRDKSEFRVIDRERDIFAHATY